ncbi:MAG: DUF434 domain-containing protein [Pseudomonadota bacterium]
MSAQTRRRGPHPSDKKFFTPSSLGVLRMATQELCWLLSRGYNENSALKLVGDRHQLAKRQRIAISRCSCANHALTGRLQSRVEPDFLKGQKLAVDGFNCLITLETALSGGLVLIGQDGCHRDLASIHGTYRAVSKTKEIIHLIGKTLSKAGLGNLSWLLDRPVSNSGRLKNLLAQTAESAGWQWDIELCNNPDKHLVNCGAIVASSDSWVIDNCKQWIDLVGLVLNGCEKLGLPPYATTPWLFDLRPN